MNREWGVGGRVRDRWETETGRREGEVGERETERVWGGGGGERVKYR